MISFVAGVFLGGMIGITAICPFRINRDGWLMKTFIDFHSVLQYVSFYKTRR